jgi:SAM-dependent methyltransferase
MNAGRLFAPRDPEVLRLGRELYAQRADLRAAFPDPEGADFHRWLGVNGVLEDERIAARCPELPPEELRSTACGGTSVHSHLFTGAEDFRMVAELYEVFAEREIASLASVLDFGCACGRLLRWFQAALPDCRAFGSDVRAASIAWCRAHLRGTFLGNGTMPPLALPDAAVELTVALSVFSHLSRAQNLAWMAELVRVTKPGGLILVSTHGSFALALTARSAEHQAALRIGAAEVPALLRQLGREGFAHRVLPDVALRRADGVADDYGQAFLTETFARQQWSPLADVLGCVPVALNLFQDVHVLRVRRADR